MADQESRGGKKQGGTNPEARKEDENVAAPTDKSQPGHAQDAKGREEYLKETK